MELTMLKCKLHRATVTQADLNYVGSITIDEDLMDTAGVIEYERVQVTDINNGNRFETYVIAGERGSGLICLNGAAARCVSVGDKIIIMCYVNLSLDEAKTFRPKVVFLNDENGVEGVVNYEKHGKMSSVFQ